VAAAVLRTEIVGDRADQRIEERIEYERDPERETGERAGQSEYLVVVEEQEQPECGVLQPLGRLAKP
jgi:hypothetical protein